MKRLICVVLMLSLMLTMVTVAPAATVAEKTFWVPNPLDLSLPLRVGARQSNTAGAYVYPPDGSLSVTIPENEHANIDYRAELDMSIIRGLFDEGFIQMTVPNDPQVKAEFEAGIVTTKVHALIEYSSAAIINSNVRLTSRNVGVLDAGSIFSESGREVNGNTLKITYQNKANLTVRELQNNIDSYLKDITFTLDNAIGYSEAGNHIVKVTMSGETLLDFASLDQRVIYSGTASNVVNVSKNDTVVKHELEVVPVKPATCFAAGESEGIICRTHNSYFECGALGTKRPEVLEKLNHIKVEVLGVSSTCTQKGILPHWTCGLCKSDFDTEDSAEIKGHEHYVVDKLPHTEISVEGQEATCTTVGFTAGKKCSECNTITQAQTIIPALGHDEVILPAESPTCTEPGKTQGLACDTCFEVLTAQIDVPVAGHKFGEWVIEEEATETSTGLMARTCSVCATREERVIEKVPHLCVADEALAVVTIEPTCTEKGALQNYCACGKPVGAAVVIPAKGHTTQWVEGTAATCVAEGVASHYVCVICDLKFRDQEATNDLNTIKTPIDKNNHGGAANYVTIKGLAPTCAKQGLTDGKKCKNCNIVVEKQALIPLTPHTLVDIPIKEATCAEHGVKAHKHCKICDKDFDMNGATEWSVFDMDIPALGHTYGEAEIVPGQPAPVEDHWDGVKECIRCPAYIEVKIPVTPDNCTHAITLDAISKNATCTELGERDKICLSCGLEIDRAAIPMTAHDLERTEVVQPTCHSKGTSAYYTCKECGKMFSGTDASVEITQVPVLDEIAHEFRVIGGGNNLQCVHCKEVVHVKKTDKDGNEDASDKIQVNNKNVGIMQEQDKIKEDSHADVAEQITIESEILINEREEVSEVLDVEIENSVSTADTEVIVDKVVWDIEINKVTTYENSGEIDREVIKEISDLIEIVIQIPAELQDSVDFLVHRLHVNEAGEQETHVITTKPDPVTGECIIINKSAGTVTLKVKKFSEYVLVGYATVVNKETSSPSTGGSSPKVFTIQFKANGGTAVENITVSYGNKITAPTTTREGYTFVGWYTDAEFTEAFDFSTAITRNLILYAKWEESVGGCDGTEADGCVSLKFKDVDTSLWYHLGIDFVIENGLMIGISEDAFAPDANITRGMLVTVLGRREGVKDNESATSTFADVASEQYYASHINWAVENNIVYGYGDSLFGPDDYITREQIAAIMHRYAQYKGYDVSVGENTNILSYDDYSSISEYAIASVQYAVGSGLMKGKSDSTFNPLDNATRAEIATILYRFIEAN